MKKQLFYMTSFIAVCLIVYVYYQFYNLDGFQNVVSTNAMIIVEPRMEPRLKAVIKNFDDIMDSSWDLYLFYGKSYINYAQASTREIVKRKVILIQLEVNNMSSSEYNFLFKQKQFWDNINAENILVFQTDAILCKKSNFKIKDFINYSYIGCSYDNKIIGKNNVIWETEDLSFYGVGGLSFRKKSFMIDCIENFPQIRSTIPEDVFFSQCLTKSPNRPPNAITLNNFCTQYNYIGNSFGAHKTNIDLKNKDIFYQYCPEAKILEI